LLYLRREVIRRARYGRPARRGTPAQTPQVHTPGSSAAERTLATLATLPLRQREVVILRYWAGLSAAEIAAVTRSRPRAVTRSLVKASCGMLDGEPAGTVPRVNASGSADGRGTSRLRHGPRKRPARIRPSDQSTTSRLPRSQPGPAEPRKDSVDGSD
jgi:hypothetical protein